MSLLDSASELASLVWSQSGRAHTASAEGQPGARSRLAVLAAVLSLAGTSACAQQPQQPVRAGPTHPFLISVLDFLGGGPPVKFWSFQPRVAQGHCARDIAWDWPQMRHLDSRKPKPTNYCGQELFTSLGHEFPVSSSPLVVTWTDENGQARSASFDVKALIGKRTLYDGGGLILEFAGARANLYLDEPDFANKKPGWYPPLVRHLLATSE